MDNGTKRRKPCIQVIGVNDKRQITAIFCGALSGDFLPVQLVYTITLTLNSFQDGTTLTLPIMVNRADHATVHEYIILPYESKCVEDCSWMMINRRWQLLTISRGK